RGVLVKAIDGGVYEITAAMKYDTFHAMRVHACNLYCLFTDELARLICGFKFFIAYQDVVDQLVDVDRVSGSPLLPRISIFHALNQRAIGRRYAKEHGKPYQDLSLIICHLGGGISVGVHHKGRVIDVNNALDGEGPFSPERAGSLP